MSAFVPLLAGGLLALAELAFSFGQPDEDPGPRVIRRLTWAAGAGVGGILVSALVLLAATVGVARSVPMTVGGTAAAVIVVALLSRAVRR
jgi:hypothetical protein